MRVDERENTNVIQRVNLDHEVNGLRDALSTGLLPLRWLRQRGVKTKAG
ncbi:hypothetical protein [Paraburkholderia dilworthii]|uniref:Transposase n=1 Tax=Paraburkholderia dilworthii TaxID=948106 RepID=A0ABW9DG84_9BURK